MQQIKSLQKPILIGIVFVALYWIIESAMMVVVFHNASYTGELFSPDIHEIWMRGTASSIIFAFVVTRQFSIAKQKRLINELKRALANVKILSGLLPTCAWCKKLKDDRGYWKSVEEYISKRSQVMFTHGMCPECFQKYTAEQNREKTVST